MESQEPLEKGGRRVQVRDAIEKQRVLNQEVERHRVSLEPAEERSHAYPLILVP